ALLGRARVPTLMRRQRGKHAPGPRQRERAILADSPWSRSHKGQSRGALAMADSPARSRAALALAGPSRPAGRSESRHARRLASHRGRPWDSVVVLLLIEVEYIFHGRDELRPIVGRHHWSLCHSLSWFCAKRVRMVSGEMRSTKPTSTALPV